MHLFVKVVEYSETKRILFYVSQSQLFVIIYLMMHSINGYIRTIFLNQNPMAH